MSESTRRCPRCSGSHRDWLPCRTAPDGLAAWLVGSAEERRCADMAESTAIRRLRAHPAAGRRKRLSP
jgi:hypothetical protein